MDDTQRIKLMVYQSYGTWSETFAIDGELAGQELRQRGHQLTEARAKMIPGLKELKWIDDLNYEIRVVDKSRNLSTWIDDGTQTADIKPPA